MYIILPIKCRERHVPSMHSSVAGNFSFIYLILSLKAILCTYPGELALRLDNHVNQNVGGNQQWLTHTQQRQEAFLQAFTSVSGSSSAGEGWTDSNAYWKHSESLHSWEWRHSWRMLFCWGRPHRYQCLLEVTLNPFTLENGGTPGGSSSAGEGCTDTNAYWKSLLIPSLLRMEALLEEALLLGKAAQIPMLTGSHS